MHDIGSLPENIAQIDRDEIFSFACHPGLKCFTECCRLLELALTPYDVLRLRKATGLSSEELLAEHIIIEQEPGEPFPRFYLTMVDDGRDSCIFVGTSGCTVYDHRPGACRAYPLGRAARRTDAGGITEHFVLIRENHCLGSLEPQHQTPTQYGLDQDLTVYNRYSDMVAALLQHPAIRDGFVPSPPQIEFFILALYNIDTFRNLLLADQLAEVRLNRREKAPLEDDERLLLFAFETVHRQLFAR
jgi:Fe-S-cluster containining protein